MTAYKVVAIIMLTSRQESLIVLLGSMDCEGVFAVSYCETYCFGRKSNIFFGCFHTWHNNFRRDSCKLGGGSSYISGSVLLLEHVNSLCIKNLLTTVWCTLFGGRSPACSQTCKIVRLPPSDIGPSSAMWVYKRRKKQWSHNIHPYIISNSLSCSPLIAN